jgi:hypothetical protein
VVVVVVFSATFHGAERIRARICQVHPHRRHEMLATRPKCGGYAPEMWWLRA